MKRQFCTTFIVAAAVAGVANAQLSWTAGSSSAGYQQANAYGGGVFVAVGPSPYFAKSTDGLTWTATASNPGDWWTGVTYGNGIFVAVATNGFATSSDGTNWSFTTPPDGTAWNGVAYGNGVFVTVANNGGTSSVMTSPDGVTWTLRTAAAANVWNGVTYGNGLFVAVAQSGSGNRVMTSPDGVTWTSRASAANLSWYSVAYGGGLFVAVAYDGVANSVMTSPDGITWTLRTAASSAQWAGVTYGNGLFVAVAQDGIANSVMTSPDGINWTIGAAATSNDSWQCVTYGNGIFVAGSTGDDTMATGSPTISGFTPTSGPAAGGTSVTITGTNFTFATAVTFGTTPASSFNVNSDTQIAAVTPAGAGAVMIGVTAPAGTGTSSGSFTYSSPAATSYTFTGPTGGPLNVGSTNFAVTPNSVYTGTVTITPSGGGLSTPVVLTFSNSSAAQPFVITPTAVGPVTLTPTNNGSLTNPSSLTYGTPPAAPTIASVTPGNAQISVAFTANATGGSAIASYTAACGSSTSSGAASPIVVTGLTNGTAYTCTVTATNTNGTSAASTVSSSATPVAPATSYTFTGPTGGALNTASTNFTVTPNSAYTGTITITPSGGGLSTPVVLTFSNSSAAQTFTIRPTAVGPVTLTPANNGSLTNPSSLTYGTPPAAPTIASVTPGNAQISVAFTANATGGSAITSYTAACGGSMIGGAASPIIVTGLTNGTPYTCTVSAANGNGTSAASTASSSVTPVAPANSYTFTGPTGGALNTASTNFAVTPNAVYTGTITITPSGGGLSTPVVLTFSNSSAAQTFTITPTAVGPVTLTPTNNGSLTNPSSLTYGTPPAAPTIASVTPGNAQISVAFTANATGGSAITSYTAACGSSTISGAGSPIVVTGLTNGTAYTCTVTAANGNGTSAASTASSSVTPVAPSTSYTFTGPTGGALNTASTNFTVTPNSVYTGTITITPSGGGLSTPMVLTFTNSSAARTFTITPTAVGPVTLTPTNNGSLANPPALAYWTPPSAPSISSVIVGNAQATVAFTAPSSTGGLAITSYWVTASPGGQTASGASTPITVTGLTNGTAYTFTVVAINSVGTGAISAASNSVTPATVPGAPTAVTATAANGSATVSFTAPANNGAAITSYTVTASPGGLTASGTSAPITVNGLVNGTTYTFTVTAANSVGTGPVSSASNSVTPAGTPAAPTGVSATAGNSQATVTFVAPSSNGGAAITNYTVTANPGGTTAAGAQSPITVTGLTNGTSYTFTVAATNSSGMGTASAPSNGVVPLGTPGAPMGVIAMAGNAQATVTFTAPSNNGGSAVSTYTVTSSPGGITASGPGSPLVVMGLTNGTAYTFTVTASNLIGVGSASVPSPSVTPESGVPGAPQGVSAATAGSGQASITFTPPANSGSSAVISYTVTSSPEGFIAAGTTSPLTVTGLANGTAYTFTVTATNAAGTGPASAASNSITPIAPLSINLPANFPSGMIGTEYPLQILTASGGVPPYTFAVTSGALPEGLTMSSPQFGGIPTLGGNFSFTIAVTDSAGMSGSGAGAITINPPSASLMISQSAVLFTLANGAGGLPSPASVTVRSTVVQQLLNYSVNVSPNVPWLNVVSGGTTTPGSIAIALASAASSLTAATAPYQTVINVVCVAPSPCAGQVQTIAVSLTVTAPPPQLATTSSLISFQSLSSSNATSSQTIGIQNTGSGTLTIESVTVADQWLSVGETPAALAAGPPVPVTVTVNPSGLSAGSHLSTLTFDSTAGTLSIPVSLFISPSSIISLAPSAIELQTTAGSPPGNALGSFNIIVAGNSAANWTAVVLPGAPWLTVNGASGTASPTTPGTVSFAIDTATAAALTPNTYYGTIQVTSQDVVDSPLNFSVILNVTSAATPVEPDLSPAGLVFVSTATSSPVPQSVNVYASSTTALEYQASAATDNQQSWLTVSPSTGTAMSGSPGSSSVSVDTAGLAPGVYTGGVSYAFSSAGVRTVNVTLIVVPSTNQFTGFVSRTLTESGTQSATQTMTQSGCVGTKLVPVHVGLVNNFETWVGWPAAISVLVLDDCGESATNAQVTTTFSTGDPPLALTPLAGSSGVFVGTWAPGSVSPQATITATATAPNLAGGSATITGQVAAGAAPLLAPNGVLNAWNRQLGGALAPGTLVEIYGSNMAAADAQALTLPLPTSLGGTSVLIGGTAVPLFYASPGQIDAQIPFELTPGNMYQVQVNNNGALSMPNFISTAPVSPAVAALASGLVIAQRYPDNSLVTENAPAKPGDYLTIFLLGMGATDQAVNAGAASPASTLIHPLIAPVLTLNGATVPVNFAGLVPGSVGLYQINFQVPANTQAGDLALVVSQDGSNSNSTFLPVKP